MKNISHQMVGMSFTTVLLKSCFEWICLNEIICFQIILLLKIKVVAKNNLKLFVLKVTAIFYLF